jgi:hypothetical protein
MSSNTTYGLSIGYWNVDGLQPKHIDKSKDVDFIDFLQKHDIVGIGETHLADASNLYFEDYIIKSVIRPKSKNSKRNFGGLSIFIKNNLKNCVSVVQNKQETNYMWVKIEGHCISRNRDLYICFLHIPHENSTYYDKIDYDIVSKLYHETMDYKKLGETALLGDFNGRVGILNDWIDVDDVTHVPIYDDYVCDGTLSKRNNLDKTVNNRGKEILDFCIAAKMRIANGRTTGDLEGNFTFFKNGMSAIDLCITDEELRNDILYFKVNELCRHLSDHCSISLKIIATFEDNNNISKGTVYELPQQFKWDDKSKTLLQMKWGDPETVEIINQFIENSHEQHCINELTNRCTNIIQNVANCCLRKSKKNKNKRKPKKDNWFDTDLENMRKNLRSESRKLKNGVPTKFDLDRVNFLSKMYKKACKRKYNEFKKKMILELENIKKNNPKEGWEALKKLKGRDTQINNISTDSWYNHYKKLNSMENDFKHIQNEQNKEIEQLIKHVDQSLFLDLNKDIDETEYYKAVRKLKNNKAAGLDLIRNEIIKSMNSKAVSMIILVFNKILKSGVYPKTWCEGVITSLYKSGDRDDENNYRGITITSCLSKLFNSILNERLVMFRKENNIDTKEQIAYQRGASTVDHIFTFNTIIEKYKKANKPLYCCFVDMKKAFDSVLHSAILLKLLKIGAVGNFFQIIKNMYENTKLSVKLNNSERTDFFDSELGIRQGDNLSPNLFNLIMNDLPKQLRDTNCDPIWLNQNQYNCMMYADDIVLLSETKQGLEKAISTTILYSKNQGLALNFKKTKVMLISKGGKFSKEIFKADDNILEEVKQYKYLGITFTNNGSLKAARTNLYNVAIKAMYGLKNLIRNIYLKVSTMLHLFTTLIQPIVSYACEVTSIINVSNNLLNNDEGNVNFFQTVMSLPQEKIHIHFCRYILGVNNKATTLAVLSELGRVPIFIHNIKRMLKFHNKCKINTKSLLYESYIESKNSELPWYEFIDYILKKAGIEDTESEYCENMACSKLLDLYNCYWKESVYNDIRQGNMRNKLRTYRQFKTIYEYEPYLKCISDFRTRQTICKFRISNHRLRIETGRFKNIPLDERKCNECNVVEDEIHFLTECSKFANLRLSLYECMSETCENFGELCNKDKFIYMMSTCNESAIKEIGKYLVKSMEKAGYIVT